MEALTCRMAERRWAFPLRHVVEVTRAVWVEPLPGAPDCCAGAINLHGTVTPVVDVRSRLGLEAAPLTADDRMLILQASGRTVAMAVTDVGDITTLDAEALDAEADVVRRAQSIRGVAATEDGVLVVLNPDEFISDVEAAAMDRAVEAAEVHS